MSRKLEEGYREKALKMYPWVCGRCAREFMVATLTTLAVSLPPYRLSSLGLDAARKALASFALSTCAMAFRPTSLTWGRGQLIPLLLDE